MSKSTFIYLSSLLLLLLFWCFFFPHKISSTLYVAGGTIHFSALMCFSLPYDSSGHVLLFF